MVRRKVKQNHVVTYNNELNTNFDFSKFNETDLNFFFAIISAMRGNTSRVVVFDVNDIKKIIQFSSRSKERWMKAVKSAIAHISKIQYVSTDNEIYTVTQLFSKFKYDMNKQTITVEVQNDFNYIIDFALTKGNWTRFDLEIFVSLRSIYSKTAFRFIKQWDRVGNFTMSIEDFRKNFYVKAGYDTNDIQGRIISVMLKELKPIYPMLKIVPNRDSSGSGRPISSYTFSWRNAPEISVPNCDFIPYEDSNYQ